MEKYCDAWREKDLVRVTVDRALGTVSVAVNGKDMGKMFEDERIRTIPLYFAVSAGDTDDEVEIMN